MLAIILKTLKSYLTVTSNLEQKIDIPEKILKIELDTSTLYDNCDFYYFPVPLKDPSLQI